MKFKLPTEEEISADDQRPDNWNDFMEMLDDMKRHVLENDGNIVEEDEPMFLRFTYRCLNSGQTWSIKIKNIRNSIDFLKKCADVQQEEIVVGVNPLPNTLKADLLSRAIMTQEGKENLLKAINYRGSPLGSF